MAPLPDQPFHVRSISMPSSRSHPLALQLEQDLFRLRASSTAAAVSPQMVCHVFQGLGDVYDRIQGLLQLPRNHQALTNPHQRKFVEAELDCSVSMLDLCDALRDNLVTAKDHVQDLGASLRRNSASFQNKVHAYTRSRNKADKDMKNRFNRFSLNNKKKSTKSQPDLDNMDFSDLLFMDAALTEAREITLSLLHSIPSFFSLKMTKHKASRWSFVSKALQTTKVACQGELQDDNTMQHQLQTLEAGVDAIHSELECLFKRLIQNRVSLLNILSL